MELYKLTDINGYTKNRTKWKEGTTLEITIPGNKLCSNQVIHAYTSPLLAELMNPAHAAYEPKLLWLAEGDIVANDGTKVGVKKLTIIKECSELLPKLTKINRISFGILSSLEVYKNLDYKNWANNWLNNIDRDIIYDIDDINDYYNAATYAINAATYSVITSTTYATYAAEAAAAVTYTFTDADATINFQLIAEKALTIK